MTGKPPRGDQGPPPDRDGALESLLLGALDPEARRALLDRARQRRFETGAMIFLRGDTGDTLYVIKSGRVEISVTSLGGRKSVLNYMGPGEVFGEVAMFDGGERSADARAVSPVAVLALLRADVVAFLTERPEAIMALVADLCLKVRNASDMFETQSQLTARMRHVPAADRAEME